MKEEPRDFPPVACTALLACPFCGGRVRIKVRRYSNTHKIYAYFIRCRCGMEQVAEMNFWSGDRKKALAEKKKSLVRWWNTRQPNAPAHREP